MDPTILVGLSKQMFAPTIPTGLVVPARLLIGLLVPWFEPRMLHNFTSSLASSIASLLQDVVIMITFASGISTLVEVEEEHSSGDLSHTTNSVIQQTFVVGALCKIYQKW